MTRRILLLLGFIVSLSYTQAQTPTNCPSPTELFASARDTIASLNWKALSSTAAYTVQYKLKSDSIWRTENTTTNTLLLRGLKTCSEYQFRVKAICSISTASDYSSVKTFKTVGCVAPCYAPRNLVGAVSDTKVALSWVATGAVAYEVQYQDITNNGNWISVKSTTPSFSALNLKPCTKYNFRVRSICGTSAATILYSDWSTSVTLATNGCVITRCVTPRIKVNVTPNAVTVNWEAATGVTYDLQIKSLKDSIWRTISNINGGTYSFVTGLTNCSVYEIRIKANCSGTSNGGWGYTTRFATLGCQPTCFKPVGLKSIVSDSVAAITWAAPQTSKFILQYKMSTETAWKSVNVSGNVYLLTGLTRCKKYNVRVQAVCGSSLISDFSDIINFETSGCATTECLMPRPLTAIDTAGVTYLTWTPTGARAYIVELRNMLDSTETWKRDTVTTSYMKLTNLAKCSKYGFRVRAICSNKITSPSDLFVFATSGCVEPCAIPVELTNQVVDNTVSFAWSGVSGQYELQYRLLSDSSWSTVPTQITGHKLVLNPCKVYVWRVRKICANGLIGAWSALKTVETKGCSTNTCLRPTNLAYTIVSDSIASINWWDGDTTTTMTGLYEVQYRLATDTSASAWKSIKAQSNATRLMLQPCKTYVWRVRQLCSTTSISDWSEPAKIETKGCVTSNCDLPANLKVQVVSDTLAYFAWTGAVGKYEIQFRTVNPMAGDTSWRTFITQAPEFKIALPRCQVLAWKVRRICDNGLASNWVEGYKFETTGCSTNTCLRPTNLAYTLLGDTTAAVYWAGGMGVYEIQYRLATDTSATAWKSKITQDSANYLALQSCKVYVWRVRKICTTALTSDWSDIAKIETKGCAVPTTCEIPTGLKTQVINDTLTYFTWTGLAGKYELQIRPTTAADTAWKTVTTIEPAFKSALPRCQVFTWRVRRICDNGLASNWVEGNKFETTGCSTNTCLRPTTLSSIIVSDTIASITWNTANPNIANGLYEIQYRLASDSSTTAWKSVTAQMNAARLMLQPCKVYVWRVRQLCSTTTLSDWSDLAKIETKGCVTPAICDAPTGLKTQLVSDTLVYFSWTGLVGKYELQIRPTTASDTTWKTVTMQDIAFKMALPRCQVFAWRVRKICDNGLASNWAEGYKFETTGCANLCPAPANVAVTASGDLYNVTWTPSTITIDTVFVQYGLSKDTTYQTLIGTTPNGVLLRGLATCSVYKVRVFRKCLNGTFSLATEKEFKTTGANCFIDNSTGSSNLKASKSALDAVKNVAVSPNPGTDYIQVQYDLNEATDIKVQLVNLQGQVVKQLDNGTLDAGNYTHYLDNLSGINQGMYFVIIRSNGQIMSTQKWMKQ